MSHFTITSYSRHTMPACNTSGKYTMQRKGNNQTPKNSQFQLNLSSANVHPRLRSKYGENLRARSDKLLDAALIDNGKSRETANATAREKLRTVVAEMIVDAKHWLRALSTDDNGASPSRLPFEQTAEIPKANTETIAKTNGKPICFKSTFR